MGKLKTEEQENLRGKYRNFTMRTQMYQQLRSEKIKAMRFIEEKYDSKNRQLKFYPQINTRKSTQERRYWKDVDGFEVVQKEEAIGMPNYSIFSK